jgi:hypothetical protein
VLICQTCQRPVVFQRSGWTHRDASPECPQLVVAWPPPETGDDTEHVA